MTMPFKEMIKSDNIGEITRADLRALSMLQLEAFAKLLGIPFSGEKDKRVSRIFDALNVRFFLRQSSDPDYYVSRFSRRELVKLTKRTASYVGSTKYGLAVGLLNWQTRCRRTGSQFYAEVKAESAGMPKQQRLF